MAPFSNGGIMIVYVVSGLPRTGTTMLMSALDAAGIPVAYSKVADEIIYETMLWKHGDKLLTGSFYEEGWQTEKDKKALDGKAVKIFIGTLWKVVASHPEIEFRVVEMTRNLEDILQSWNNFSLRKIKWTIDEIETEYKKQLALVKGDNVKILQLHYEDVVANPEEEMHKLVEFGIPISIEKAVTDIRSGRSKRIKESSE